MRKYTLNEKYFDEIDSANKVYFLGYLMADGYNSEARGVIEISCAEKDEAFLEILNQTIGSSKPLRFVRNKKATSYRISFCSRNISDKLVKLGCVQAKTFKLKFPSYLNDEMHRHFIRGYFDGDGCVSYTFAKRDNFFGNSFLSVATITSTETFCLYIKEYIKEKLNINSTMLCRHPKHKNNNRTLQISGNRQVIKFLEWIYLDADLFLKRKREKIDIIQFIIKERNIIVHEIRSKNGKAAIANVNRQRRQRNKNVNHA